MTIQVQKLKNALLLLRIPFSVFLMPVYWFALSNTGHIETSTAVWIFVILHLFIYPASNGYNSYYDKDTTSIGGIKNPPAVSSLLYWLVLFFDIVALVLSFLFINITFFFMMLVYLLVSKAYSYDRIRLKKLPLTGTLVVTVFQGAFTYIAVRYGLEGKIDTIDLAYALVSTLFLAGSYPLTQVYQHQEDADRGDITLSIILGIKGTFRFAQTFIAAGSLLLIALYLVEGRFLAIPIFIVLSLPVLVYFNKWKVAVKEDETKADFENTMKMNQISSIALSAVFVLVYLAEKTKLFF